MVDGTKNDYNPTIPQTELDRLASFYVFISRMSAIERKCYHSKLERQENDAEHSWHLVMGLVLFSKYLPAELDLLQMLKMGIVHDLVEVYAGDTPAYDTGELATQKQREHAAIDQICEQLPVAVGNEIKSLFIEYDQQKTPEAKMVGSFDRLQVVAHNLDNDWSVYTRNGIPAEQMDRLNRKHMMHSPLTITIYEHFLGMAKKAGHI